MIELDGIYLDFGLSIGEVMSNINIGIGDNFDSK
jgi:hypothetical protein